MNYQLIIDTLDNNAISNKISTQLYNKLQGNGYNTILLNNNQTTSEKIKEINKYGENTIVISNQMNNLNTSEIIYSLYYDNVLPILIDDYLNNILTITKFYQLRLPGDTAKDYYEIIRETPKSESIIIRYENINENLIDNIVNNLYEAITDYIKKENIYIVQSGDSLYSIAKKFNVSVNDLKDANNLVGTNLSIGQELIIPQKTTNNENISNTYIVQSGDTLYKIANKFNLTVNELKELNNLTSNTLSIGQKLIIKQDSNINKNNTYIVVSGDSLYKIANKFNTTVDELKKLNNLTTNSLSIGQVLLIPNSNNNYQTYTVVKGDSLYTIANKFNTTVNEIINLNKLTSNILSIGQTLLIPTTNNYQTYIVVSGDSLYKIANKFNTTVNKIKELNNLTSNLLSIGQTLLIPN